MATTKRENNGVSAPILLKGGHGNSGLAVCLREREIGVVDNLLQLKMEEKRGKRRERRKEEKRR